MALALAAMMAAVGALLAGEVFVRLCSKHDYLTPAAMKKRSLEYDSTILRRYVFPQKEKDVIGVDGARWHINRLGYRGPDFDVQRPSGTLRIIIYGGSQVFDFQEKDWPHRVEGILRKSGFPEAEVINAGIPGLVSFDSFESLFTEGHALGPDYVILDSAWNDLDYFTIEKPFLRSALHQRVLSGDPRVTYFGTLDRLLCGMSQLYGRLRDRYVAWRFGIGGAGMKRRGEPSSKISGMGVRQYRLNIEMFADCARDIGAVPVLMTEPRLVHRRNTEAEERRIGYEFQPFTHDVLRDALDKADETVLAVAKEKKAALIDASREMTGKGDLFVDHVHLSGAGSEKMAELVARSLAGILKHRRPGSKFYRLPR